MNHSERDDKWFLEFASEMVESKRVVIVNMCEEWEVCKCKDTSMKDASETKRVIVVCTYEADTLVCKFLYQRVWCH